MKTFNNFSNIVGIKSKIIILLLTSLTLFSSFKTNTLNLTNNLNSHKRCVGLSFSWNSGCALWGLICWTGGNLCLGATISQFKGSEKGEKVLGTLQLVGFSDEIISEKFLEIQERVFSVPIIDNDKGTAMYRTLRLPAQKLVFAPGLKGYPVVLEIVE